MASTHLEEIIEKQNRVASVQVVFFDIEKYSQRRTQNQIAVIDAFTESLKTSLGELGREYLEYFQKRDLNLSTDAIVLPTGDGAAVGLTFDGVADMHLRLALNMLKNTADKNGGDCDRFEANGWCNCHPYFRIRVGVADGKAVIYKDANGNYNLAGTPINMAARIMGSVGPSQLAFTEEAYSALIDLADDPMMLDHFKVYPGVPIKHGLKVSVYQYRDPGAQGIDDGDIEDLIAMETMKKFMESFGPSTPSGEFDPKSMVKAIGLMESAMNMISGSTIDAQGSPSLLRGLDEMSKGRSADDPEQ